MKIDDGIVTQAAVARTLPASIRDDFLPLAEQDFGYVCSYPGRSSGFLVNHGALVRSMAALTRRSS